MKLLKLSVSGLPLFKGDLEFEFVAKQRVDAHDKEHMHNLFAHIYQNNAISITGINAAGKTTLLKVLTFSMDMLKNTPINNASNHEILDGLTADQQVTFNCYFYASTEHIHYLRTVIRKENARYIIASEELKSRKICASMTKRSLYDFDNVQATIVRNNNEEYLLDDVSIMVAFNKRSNDPIYFASMLQSTNMLHPFIQDSVPPEVIAYFDPSIEYLRVKKSSDKREKKVHLKFCGKEELVLNHISDLNMYLSSGTIKGINTYIYAVNTFKAGGYLIVDDLEAHFNKEIVTALIHFYWDNHINPNGATLIFTTHFAEILNEFARNDCIYIVRNNDGITAVNMPKEIKRNNIKKSERYESDFLGGTVPKFDAYMNLKKLFMRK